MKQIHVQAGSGYDVLIEAGGLDRAGEYLRKVKTPCRAAVISDSHVLPLYGDRVASSLRQAGFEVSCFAFPAGEENKNLTVYASILDFLAREHFSRSDILIALGGGVTGDMAGFAAATYLRGIPFMQIPTTLLAAVDSSVGGKTGVDLPGGKNLVGAFHQPLLVLCDPDLIRTLPEDFLLDGSAEVIKYGMLGNEAFFAELEKKPIRDQLEHVIETCVRMKRDLVEADEFDTGERRKLNFGHSFGHAIEKCSGYTLSHGLAVSVGMVMISDAAVKKGFLAAADRDRLVRLLEKTGLPTHAAFSKEELLAAVLSDKKMAGGRLHLVVPEAVGRCRIVPVSREEITGWMA